MDTRIVEIAQRVNDKSNTIDENDRRSRQTESNSVEACDNIVKRYLLKETHTDLHNDLNVKVESLRVAFDRLEIAIATATAVDSDDQTSNRAQPPNAPPQNFNINTPSPTPPRPDQSRTQYQDFDPWRDSSTAQRPAAQPQDSFGPSTDNATRIPSNGGAQTPFSGMPSSTRPGMAATHQNPFGHFGPGNKVQHMGDQDAMQRKSESARKFSGKTRGLCQLGQAYGGSHGQSPSSLEVCS